MEWKIGCACCREDRSGAIWFHVQQLEGMLVRSIAAGAYSIVDVSHVGMCL